MPPQRKKGSSGAAPREKIEVHAHDVLNGRGVNIAQHPGNLRFRALVKSHADQSYCSEYSTSAKKAVAEEIIQHIRNLDPPGRFLKPPSRSKKCSVEDGSWEELPYREVLKKTCQALRDCNRADRSEYARHIEAPEDVQVSSETRQQSGLSKREYAEQIAVVNAARSPAMNPSAPVPPSAVCSTSEPPMNPDSLWVNTSSTQPARQPDNAVSFTPTPKPTATPATAASSGAFQNYPDEHDDHRDFEHSEDELNFKHPLMGVHLPHFGVNLTNSPVPMSGLEYDPFGFENDAKLESGHLDFDEGCRESAEAILGRSLDEGADLTTIFDGDICI